MNFNSVKDGIESFKTPARKKSSSVIHVSEGIAVLDLGRVSLTNGIQTRIIVVRRINRKRKKGKRQINTYYYAVASNLALSASELYAFCHKRQCIEAGFRELKNHYNPERIPFRSLKADEFWVTCKIAAIAPKNSYAENFSEGAVCPRIRKSLSCPKNRIHMAFAAIVCQNTANENSFILLKIIWL